MEGLKMEISDSDKVTVLLHLFDQQTRSIDDRVTIEKRWFEWSTNLLLAAFAAIVALSGINKPLPNSQSIKVIASLLVMIPAILSILRIHNTNKGMMINAFALERIEELLHLFESGVYGEQSPFPTDWKGTLASGFPKRKTPVYYSAIIIAMTLCVVFTIWLAL